MILISNSPFHKLFPESEKKVAAMCIIITECVNKKTRKRRMNQVLLNFSVKLILLDVIPVRKWTKIDFFIEILKPHFENDNLEFPLFSLGLEHLATQYTLLSTSKRSQVC